MPHIVLHAQVSVATNSEGEHYPLVYVLVCQRA